MKEIGTDIICTDKASHSNTTITIDNNAIFTEHFSLFHEGFYWATLPA